MTRVPEKTIELKLKSFEEHYQKGFAPDAVWDLTLASIRIETEEKFLLNGKTFNKERHNLCLKAVFYAGLKKAGLQFYF